MKLFIISDIHGSLIAFEKALNQFEKENADYLVICGDFLNHGPRNNIPAGYDTKKLAEKLNSYKDKIIGIRGNCDSEVDQMILDFPMMAPFSNIFLETKHRVFVHHGHLFSENELRNFLSEKSIVVSGHTHVPVLENNDDLITKTDYEVSLNKIELVRDEPLMDMMTTSIGELENYYVR